MAGDNELEPPRDDTNSNSRPLRDPQLLDDINDINPPTAADDATEPHLPTYEEAVTSGGANQSVGPASASALGSGSGTSQRRLALASSSSQPSNKCQNAGPSKQSSIFSPSSEARLDLRQVPRRSSVSQEDWNEAINLSTKGHDSPYTSILELPNSGNVDAMTGNHIPERAALIYRRSFERPRESSSTTTLASRRHSLATSFTTTTSNRATGTGNTNRMSKLVSKTNKANKKKRGQDETDLCADSTDEEEEEEEEDDTSFVPEDKKDQDKGDQDKERKDRDSSHPILRLRGGSCSTEVLCNFQTSNSWAPFEPSRLFRHPNTHDPRPIGVLSLQPCTSIQGNTKHSRTEFKTSPHGINNQSPKKQNFLMTVRDVNSGVLLQQEITPGKLVKVKYAYGSKRPDEFNLDIEDLLVVLLIVSDYWALGCRYEDALEYISTRPEFSIPDPANNPHGGCRSGSGIPLITTTMQLKDCMPMMKFFPLEAVQLVQPYEWAFQPYSTARSTLKQRSILRKNSTCGSSHNKLHNPPPRGVSKKLDLIYGENKRFLALGFDKLVAEILQKIIEEAKTSVQYMEAASPNTTPPCSPTSTGMTISEMASSIWPPTVVSSPISDCSGTGTRNSVAGASGHSMPSPSNMISMDQRSLPTIPQHISPSGSSDIPVDVFAFTTHPIDTEVANTESTDRHLNPPEDIPDKPQKKHIFKDSLRWATKQTEKFLSSMLKKRNKYSTALDIRRAENGSKGGLDDLGNRKTDERMDQEAPNPSITGAKTDFIGKGSFLNASTSGGLPHGSEQPQLPSSTGPHLGAGGIYESGAVMPPVRPSRPSLRDLFAKEMSSTSSKIPLPRLTLPESPFATEDSFLLDSQPLIPRLSIDTEVYPVHQRMNRTTFLGALSDTYSSPSSGHEDSVVRKTEDESYRLLVNSPTSRSEAKATNNIGECIDRGQYFERALSPTCANNPAARGLMSKMKDTIRGHRARESSVDSPRNTTSPVHGKENQQVIYGQAL